MKYHLVLSFETKEAEKVFRICRLDTGKKDRANIKISKSSNKILFEVNAKDSIALKASINSVIKGLTIYEKTKELIQNG